MTHPLVTVILPTYNGAAFLEAALASIRAQTQMPLEIFVVDDGSTDATGEIARAAQDVIFVSQTHRGRPAFGRNTGIRQARGEFITFLDQDDVWADGALETQLAAFAQAPELHVVVGRAQTQKQIAKGAWENDGAPLPQPFVSSSLFRREGFARVGLFDETLEYLGDDTDWFARARQAKLPMKMLDTVTLYWRIHANNASHRNLRDHARGVDRPLVEIVKQALDRKRARGEL